MSERLLVSTLYAGALLLTVWAGGKAIGYFQDYRFYSTFLAPWQRALGAYGETGRPWPVFSGSNHVAYMEAVVSSLRGAVGFRPLGEGRGAFMYRVDKPGQDGQDVFLLALPGRIVLYGLFRGSAERVDGFVDGQRNLGAGTFQAAPSQDGLTVTAVWRY